MKFKSRNIKGKCTTKMDGMLTIYTAHESKDKILKPLENCKELILDMSLVTEIDTAGLQLLMLVKREASKINVIFNLKNISASTATLLQSYCMTDALEPILKQLQNSVANGGV